jgi:outer membrane protein assembly factor BamB
MRKSLTGKFILLLVCISILAHAQPKTPPAWSYKFKTPIQWQRVHSLGHIIVSTSEGLFAISPNDGKLLWENRQFPSLNPDMYSEISGTEFISISYMTDKSTTIPMQAIIEVVGGKTLFDSQKESIGVLSRHVLASSGKLLVIGMRPKNLVASLLMYDIASGAQLWANDELFKAESSGKGLLAKLQTMSTELSSLQALSSEPVELDPENILITHPNYVIRINSSTGKVVWKNSIQASKRAGIYFSSYKKNIVYIGTEVESSTGSGFTTSSSSGASKEPQKFYTNLYYAYDVNTGASLWKQPAKENDLLNEVIISDKGLIICPRSSQKPTINLVNYETGQTMWGNKGKGIKAQGSLVSYLPTEKGLLITTAFDNAWNSKAEEYYLNILDPNAGKLLYEKSVKLKGDLVRSEMTPKGLLFITTKEVNILDTNTGTLLWASSIEAGNPFNSDVPRPFPTGDNGSGKLYVYSPKDKAVYEVDKQAGTNRKMTSAKIEFEGKEIPRAIDVVSDGLIIYSEQNIMKLAMDGTVKYSKYYPAPRQPALVRALLMAEAVRAAYIGAVASTYSAAFAQASAQSSDPTAKQVGTEISRQFGQVGEMGFAYSSRALKEFNARYKASKSTPNFIMIMTTQEKKGNQLVQVNKTNGEIISAIDIKNDKEPEYDVDQIYNYIYYRPNGNEIVCYKL